MCLVSMSCYVCVCLSYIYIYIAKIMQNPEVLQESFFKKQQHMFFAAFPTKPRSYHYLESSSTDIKSRDSHLAGANVPGASTAFFFGLGLWAWLF